MGGFPGHGNSADSPLRKALSPCVRGVSVQDLVGQPWKKNMSQAGASCQLPRPRLWVQDARLLQLLLRLKALLLLPLSQELGEGVCAGSTQSGTFTPSYHLSRERPHLVSLARHRGEGGAVEQRSCKGLRLQLACVGQRDQHWFHSSTVEARNRRDSGQECLAKLIHSYHPV